MGAQDGAALGRALSSLPLLASLTLELGADTNAGLLCGLAQSRGSGVLQLSTLRFDEVDLRVAAPLCPSLCVLHDLAGCVECSDLSLLCSACPQLKELQLSIPLVAGHQWEQPSLQRLALKYDVSLPELQDVALGDLPALQRVEVQTLTLPGLPLSVDTAASTEELRTCPCLLPGLEVHGLQVVHDEGRVGEGGASLGPWLQPLASLFALRSDLAHQIDHVRLRGVAVDAGGMSDLAVFSGMRSEAAFPWARWYL